MSDSEEENFCFFGKPLEQYDEDAIPKKKPISVEDQIATDEQGRRRFHGAFTGGFSAGFFNTVGSLEGWTPSEFKSSRQDKAKNAGQKPEDFMDSEDLSEFGIAPQTIKATKDYSTSRKRKRQMFNDGPIPGEPVLHSILSSGNETIGYLLLKNIGSKARREANEDNLKQSENKTYGCVMPKTYEIARNEDFKQYPLPDIYKENLAKPKDNTFGLGYIGLNKSHINLFTSANLVINEPNKKKVTISGQAFGVGAFEDDDEDIYVKDDMSKYDFELTSEKVAKKSKQHSGEVIFNEFVVAKVPFKPRETFLPPTIPHSFTGKHKIKKSRFEPIPEPQLPDRSNMNPEIRARYLGEEVTSPIKAPEVVKPSEEQTDSSTKSEKKHDDSKKFDSSSFMLAGFIFDKFVSASEPENPSDILEVVKPSENIHGTQEMRDAARMKMFGPLTRVSFDWNPCPLLCKRFNVPEPHLNDLNSTKSGKRTRNLIFEYEKFSDVTDNFKPGLVDVSNTQSSIADFSQNKQGNEDVNATDKDVVTSTENTSTNQDQDQLLLVETPKDITEKIDVDKNADLFKAVFLSSSSESEGEEDDDVKKETISKDEEMKINVLSDNLLPKIKPLKEGILSNMDFSLFNEEGSANVHDTTEKLKDIEQPLSSNDSSDVLSYGPKLPERVPSSQCNVTVPAKGDSEDDEWIEVSKKNKKSKKHKNKKSSHSHKKKHKHKKNKAL